MTLKAKSKIMNKALIRGVNNTTGPLLEKQDRVKVALV